MFSETITLKLGSLFSVLSSLLFIYLIFIFKFDFIFCLCLFRVALSSYGGSQARGLIGAFTAGLRQSHSNSRSELCLRPTPQLTETPDP